MLRPFLHCPAPCHAVSILLLAGGFALCGCDLSDPARISLEIVAPLDGTTFSSEDDRDPDLVGTQIEVTVNALGIDDDAVLELYRLEAGEPLLATLTTASVGENQAVFRGFTLRAGENVLQARLLGSSRTSSPVIVRFRDTCGKLGFVEPSTSDTESIRLGPTDDLDKEACGDTFTTRVIASTGLPDGSEVVLLVNGSDNRSTSTVGGVAVFDQVVLGKRGDEANRLALRVASSECPVVELDADVLVDCEGPSCSLDGPTGPNLNSLDDEDPNGAGLQVELRVETDEDVSEVQLLINGDIDNAILAEAREGKAVASDVALPEGTSVRVKAICTGDKGARSTDERLYNVDTTACAVSITSPLANTAFVAAQPSPDSKPASTLETILSAEVGSDCVSVRFAALPSADCAGIEREKAIPLLAGQGSVNAPLTLSAQGKQFVCVETADEAGNTTFVNAPVSFDRQTPMLDITSPAGSTSYVLDANSATAACDVPMSVSCDENDISVQILRASDQTVLAATSCTAGVANFASVPLPISASAYAIIARAIDPSGLTGSSEARTVTTTDCEP